jgi:hypothetical protein
VSDTPPYLTLAENGVYLRLHAQPGARQAGLRGLHGDALKVAVRDAAQDGKANAAIAVAVAKGVGVAKTNVTIVSGHQSRSKRCFIEGDPATLQQAIEQWLSGK